MTRAYAERRAKPPEPTEPTIDWPQPDCDCRLDETSDPPDDMTVAEAMALNTVEWRELEADRIEELRGYEHSKRCAQQIADQEFSEADRQIGEAHPEYLRPKGQRTPKNAKGPDLTAPIPKTRDEAILIIQLVAYQDRVEDECVGRGRKVSTQEILATWTSDPTHNADVCEAVRILGDDARRAYDEAYRGPAPGVSAVADTPTTHGPHPATEEEGGR